jgi:hypothetical protein
MQTRLNRFSHHPELSFAFAAMTAFYISAASLFA